MVLVLKNVAASLDLEGADTSLVPKSPTARNKTEWRLGKRYGWYLYGADVNTERTVKATFHNIMICNYLVVTDLNGDNEIEEYFQSNTWEHKWAKGSEALKLSTELRTFQHLRAVNGRKVCSDQDVGHE